MKEETFTEFAFVVQPGPEQGGDLKWKGDKLSGRVSLRDKLWRLLVLLAAASPFIGPWVEVGIRIWKELR